MNKSKAWIGEMNRLGVSRTPFFFLISFDKYRSIIQPLTNLSPDNALEIKGQSFGNTVAKIPTNRLYLQKHPADYSQYQKGFDKVMAHLKRGDSFLTNYTMPTPISLNYSLRDLYAIASAKYKLLVEDQVLCFSPESFVTTMGNYMYSYPMKGTIDASIPNAKDLILSDPKELAEHYTIVDLIRNDLSQVCKKVEVPRFRYVDEIKGDEKTLLQVSSEIRGELSADFRDHLGDIFDKLLPAGSISGAPKTKTLDIIKNAELDNRGYYTGVFGIFDGENIDSAVAIRFIEKKGEAIVYRSGGGITHKSDPKSEYQEMIDKIYVPISREYKDSERSSEEHRLSQPTV